MPYMMCLGALAASLFARNDKYMWCFMFKQWIEHWSLGILCVCVFFLLMWWLSCVMEIVRWRVKMIFSITLHIGAAHSASMMLCMPVDTWHRIISQQHNIFIITTTFNTIYLWGRIGNCVVDAFISILIWIG